MPEEPEAPEAPEGQADAQVDASDAVEEVIVAGTPISKTAGSAHVIREQELERYEYDDAHAVLASVPGVYTRGEDGLGLRPNIGMRGVNPDRSKKVTLLEDGILFGPAPYSAPAAYFFPLMTRMTYVRVIKGPGAIAYGPQTVGGSIDLITRPIPTDTEGHVDIAAGEYGYRKAHGYFGSSDGKTGFLLEGVHIGNDGFKELPSGADTGFVKNEWMAKASYNPDPTARVQQEIGLKLTYADEISNETYLGLSDPDFARNALGRYAASQLDRMTWHRTSLVLTHKLAPSPNFSVTTNVYRHDFSRTWRKVNRFRGASLFDVLTTPDAPQSAVYLALLNGQADSSSPAETLFVGPNARDFVSEGVELRARWDVATGAVKQRIEYGVNLHYDRIERRHSEDSFSLIGGDLVPDGGPTIVTAFNEAASHAAALHVVDAISVGRLTLTPGVRTEAISARFLDRTTGQQQGSSTFAVVPGIGAFYALFDHLGVLAGVYRGFSPPAPGSEEHVKPELSVNYEAGVRFATRKSRLEALGFYNAYSNLTDVCTFSSGCLSDDLDRQFDAGKARIYGAELTASHDAQLASELSAPLRASYTFTRSEFLNAFSSDDPIFGQVSRGDEIPYVPRHQAHASAGVEGARWAANLALNYVASAREVAGQLPLNETLASDEQLTLDASGSWRLNEHFGLYANVRNVTDARYILGHRPYGARPNAPRWVQIGLKAGF